MLQTLIRHKSWSIRTAKSIVPASFLLVPLFTLSCGKSAPSKLDAGVFPLCTSASANIDPDGDGWGWENNQSCRVTPFCSSNADADGDGWGWENSRLCRITPLCQDASSDPDGDGWGWENGASCKVVISSSPQLVFSTTYYPYANEEYFRTVCGDADAYQGLYFAVTENSPLWNGSCDNDSWAECTNADCLGKWNRMPPDVKRVVDGKRLVREPTCNVPCGKAVTVYSEDRRISSPAVVYDACPSQHWNNRFKEVTQGYNPCARASMHLDLRKPLYLKLTRGFERGNIRVWVEPK